MSPTTSLHWTAGIQGIVTVGALPLGRTLILPEAVTRVVTRFPKVRLITDESSYEALVAGVHAGDIDFILGALRVGDPTSALENERLMSETSSYARGAIIRLPACATSASKASTARNGSCRAAIRPRVACSTRCSAA